MFLADKRMFQFMPFRDHSIDEPARLLLYDNRRAQFALKHEIGIGLELSVPFDVLEEHLDYKFKIQTKLGGRWVDRTSYTRLLPESKTDDGIKHLYYPCKGADKLIVVFQAINRKPGYNYIKTLSGIHAHRLYIKDDYGEDPNTRTSYYLGKHRSFDIAEKVQKLLITISSSLGIRPRDFILSGSSKGGFAALYHGYRFGAGHILPGGPQIFLGDFLNSLSKDSVHPPILDYLTGGRDKESVAWANGILQETILSSSTPFPYTEIHVGRNEPHYHKHVLPFLEWAVKTKIPNVTMDLGDYGTHRELAAHYPMFLRDRVERIVLGV
jgi:accessory secretory protein Asp2